MPSCDGKKKYGTEALALAVADTPTRPAAARMPLFVYQCGLCHCWHLTRMPPRTFKRKARRDALAKGPARFGPRP